MKHQTILRAYKACLRLYPAAFRHRYGEQMQLTAGDLLDDSHTPAEALRSVARLMSDTGIGLVREHGKQLGGKGMNKQPRTTVASMRSAALLGFQIVWVLVMVFLFLEPIVHTITERKDPYVYIVWADSIAPVCILVLSLYVLKNLRDIAAWSWIVRGFVMATIGLLGLGLFSGLVDHAWQVYGLWHRFSVNGSVYDWSILLVFLASFYTVSQWFVRFLTTGTARVGGLSVKRAKHT